MPADTISFQLWVKSPRATPAVLAAALILLAVPGAPAQVHVGGEAALSHSVWYAADDPHDWEIDSIGSFSPIVSVHDPLFSLFAEARISRSRDAAELSPTIREMKLEFYPLPSVVVTAGRYLYLPSPAEFLASSNYFERSDPTALLGGDREDASVPTDLFQTTVALASTYGRLTVAPFRPQPIVIPVESAWFPATGLPRKITIDIPGAPLVYERENIVYEFEEYAGTVSEISAAVEFGGYLGGAELAVHGFSGYHPSPAMTVGISQIRAGRYFDVILRPETGRTYALGATARVRSGAFHAWADASYSVSRLFSTGRVTIDRRTGTDRAPSLQWTAGARWDSRWWGNPTLIGEYRRTHVFGEHQSVIRLPALSYAAAGAVFLQTDDRKWRSGLGGLFDAADESFVLFVDGTAAPSESLEFAVRAPFFFGDTTSFFGQYRDNRTVTTVVTVRF